MANTGLKVPIPKTPPKMLSLSESIIVKHTADGANSVLAVIDADDMEDKTIAARAKDTLALEKNRDKELAYEDRDIALGIAPGHQLGETGTVYYYVKATRDILLGVNKGNEHVLGDWGFEVKRETAKIEVPRNAEKMITLGTNILAQNTLLSTASPIKALNIVEFTAKLGIATAKNTLANQLNHEKQAAYKERDIILGIDRKQKVKNTATIKFYLTSVRDILRGIYKNNESALELWGFDVIYGSTPTPLPPTEICLTGIITDINHNPVNNANVKIVQLNVSVQSNAEGIYEFPMQTEGTYTIEVSKQNCETQLCAGIVIKAGTVRNLNVQLNSILGSIIANVFFNGQPLSGAVVAITQINLSAVTDGSGIANLNNIPVGNYNVLATATGKAPFTYPITIELNTISSITFNMVEQS